MERSIGELVFDDQDFTSIIAHAKKLEGKTLKEVATYQGTPDLLRELSGKGAAGQLLQVWFGLPVRDSNPRPDLPNVRMPDGTYADIEIKVVSLTTRGGAVSVKERCKVTNIDYHTLVKEEWQTSRARHKLLVVLFIYYRYTDKNTWPDSTIDKVLTWRLEDSEDKSIIYNDWRRTWDFVNEGRAHEISEAHGSILGASTAGTGGRAGRIRQPNNPSEYASKRAFSLKPSFLKTRYEMARKPSRYVPARTLIGHSLGGDMQNDVLGIFDPYIGIRLDDLRKRLGAPPSNAKNAAASLVKRLLGVSIGDKKALELASVGIKPKTVPVGRENFKPFEAMSFPAMDLAELVEEEWEESELRADLDCLLMVPIVGDDKKQPYMERRLGRPFFWVPTPEEEQGIEKEWRQFRSEVLAGHAAYQRTKRGRSSKLTRGSETEFIHMRTKGRDGRDDGRDQSGRSTQKLCFWLNQRFVERILKGHFGSAQKILSQR